MFIAGFITNQSIRGKKPDDQYLMFPPTAVPVPLLRITAASLPLCCRITAALVLH